MFVLPYFLVHVINVIAFPRGGYGLTLTDATAFFLGTGLNWVTLAPLHVWHLPGYIWSQISALMIICSGIPSSDLGLFQAMGVTIQILLIPLSGWWVARLNQYAKLPPHIIFVLSCIGASMPAALEYSRFWGGNYPVSVAVVPIAMGLFAILSTGLAPRWIWYAVLSPFAFLASNFSPGLSVMIAAVVACTFHLFIHRERVVELHEFRPSRRNGTYVLLVVLSTLFTKGLIQGVLYLPRVMQLPVGEHTLSVLSTVATVISPIVGYVCVTFAWDKALPNAILQLIVGPSLVGWAIGTNVCCLSWASSVVRGLVTKGASGSESGLSVWIHDVKLWNFVLLHAWNSLFCTVVIACVWSVIGVLRRGGGSCLCEASRAVFLTASLILMCLSSAEVAFRIPDSFSTMGNGLFGIVPMRYFVFAPIPICFSVIYLGGRPWFPSFRFVGAILGGVAVLSFAEYVIDQRPYICAITELRSRLNTTVASHLSQQRWNQVVCARVTQPERGELLYGLNNYRTETSLQRSRPPSLDGGRIVYSGDIAKYPHAKDLVNAIPQYDPRGETLVIHDSKATWGYLTTLWTDRRCEVSVSRLNLTNESPPHVVANCH